MNRPICALAPLLFLWLCAGCGSGGVEAGSANPADLWRFAALGNVQGVRQLADAGTDLNALDPIYSMSAIEMASAYGQPGVVEVLIEAGADVNARNDERGTACLAAAFFGRVDCLRLLVANGGDPTLVNQDGVSPMFATYFDQTTTEMIADLLQMEIDFASIQAGRESCLEVLGPYYPGFVPPPTSNGTTDSGEALFASIAFGDLPGLNRLLASGASLEVRDSFGSTPLGVAAFFCRSDCMAALLRAGADPRVPNSDGSTPLQIVDQVPWSTVREISDSFGIPLDRSSFERGRAECRSQLEIALQ